MTRRLQPLITQAQTPRGPVLTQNPKRKLQPAGAPTPQCKQQCLASADRSKKARKVLLSRTCTRQETLLSSARRSSPFKCFFQSLSSLPTSVSQHLKSSHRPDTKMPSQLAAALACSATCRENRFNTFPINKQMDPSPLAWSAHSHARNRPGQLHPSPHGNPHRDALSRSAQIRIANRIFWLGA